MEVSKPNNRIGLIDSLRGFALLGVLIANTLAFAHKEKLLPNLADLSSSPDLRSFVYFFVEGSFYPLFTFLFGYGLAMQLAKAEDLPYLRLRLTILFVFGLLHGIFLFSGDILHAYALLGLASLPFYRHLINSKHKVRFFSILLILSVLIFWGVFELEANLDASSFELTDYGNTSYWSITQQRFSDFLAALITLPIFSPQLLFFLGLGMVFQSRNVLEEASHHRRFWQTLFLICTLFSLTLLGVFYLNPELLTRSLAQSIELTLFSPALGFAYFSGMVLLYPYLNHLLKPLAAVGKLSLSNYLTQSLVMTTLFNGYGLGWFDRFSLGSSLSIALILFILQIILSNLWLRYFRYGPVEWLWRSLSYKQRLSLRRQR
ncbi:MAG: DUF418 domain-containing protein [Trueperaceae bacterium]|nr:DUF418 domain-containing protein [Trueperaceae bacterium]